MGSRQPAPAVDPRAGDRWFFRGSVLFQKGLHHVVCILVPTVDYGFSHSVAAPRTKTHPSRRSVLPRLEGLEDRSLPSTLHGDQPAYDSGAGSLRAAIAIAHSGDTIDFAQGLHGTITLTSSDLPISDSVTINGPGANKLSVSGNNSSRDL